MISIPQAKKWLDNEIVKHLEATMKVLTIADLGLKAKQSDVTKVKALIQKRINKITGYEEAKGSTRIPVPVSEVRDPS